ncbi:MAG: DUF3300 domain-containing protein [Burkholderiaceae bacterium]|nr:DUF3300 domain-containing protein [Burkholderiaceae bacterium]
MKRRGTIAWLACAAATTTMMLAPTAPSHAQEQVYASAPAQAPYAQEELDQMLAPIALYPDALLAQVLMASTWPLDVVQADRFVRQNPGLTGDALADAVEAMPWDPSVRALTQFPSVLAMMSERLEWTEQLGDALLAQRDQMMDTVQSLRARAWAAGTLYSTDQQQVIVQDRIIAIEPARPGYLWVPYYNPVVVFGAWWWPDRPPFFWVPPPAYRPPHFSVVYGSGFAWSPYVAVRPRLWHDPRPVWRNRYVVVDNHRVNNVIVTRPGASGPVIWRHDSERRRGGEWQGRGGDWQGRDRQWQQMPGPGPRDFRNGRGAGDRDFGQRRDDATPRNPPPQRRPESIPQRVQKPMPVPRAEPQGARIDRPQQPWASREPPRMQTPSPRAEPRPQMATPPRMQPERPARPAPGQPEARGPRFGDSRGPHPGEARGPRPGEARGRQQGERRER